MRRAQGAPIHQIVLAKLQDETPTSNNLKELARRETQAFVIRDATKAPVTPMATLSLGPLAS
jgi:hypothetical protein